MPDNTKTKQLISSFVEGLLQMVQKIVAGITEGSFDTNFRDDLDGNIYVIPTR